MFTRAQLDTFTDQQLELLSAALEDHYDGVAEEPDEHPWYTPDEVTEAANEINFEQRRRAALDEKPSLIPVNHPDSPFRTFDDQGRLS